MIDTQKYMDLIKESEMAKDLEKLNDLLDTVSSLLVELQSHRGNSYSEVQQLETLICCIFHSYGKVSRNREFKLSKTPKLKK